VKEWKAFLDEVPEANAFQTPEMRDVFDATRNYEAVVIATEKNGEINDLLLASIIKEGGGIKGSFSSRAIVTGGPVSKGGDFKEIVKAFDEIAAPKSLYAQFRNLNDMSASHQVFEGLGYAFEQHLNYIHDLKRPLSEIWAGFSDGRRKGIKKAEARGLEIREGDKGDIDNLYELVSSTYEEVGIPLADKSLFTSAWRVMKPSNMVRLFLAFQGEELLAGRIILTYHGMIHDWYAGSGPGAKGQNANELLVWSVMKWGSESGFRLFDFGGAGKPGEKYGPGEFKRRFGGTLTNFGRFEKVYHPVKHFVGRKGYEVLRRLG